MSFIIRKFEDQDSLGAKLKSLRKSANITLSEMAKLTKIQKSYLKAFETEEYNKLPDPVYARNFLRIYVKTLKADESYFLERFEAEYQTCTLVEKTRLPRKKLGHMLQIIPSKIAKTAALVLVVMGVTYYIGSQINTMISPPDLLVYSPNDGAYTHEAVIVVTGQVEEDSSVMINGSPVLLSQDGAFAHEVALERGMNVIEIEGTKRYSKKAKELRRVLLDQDRSITFTY